MARKTTSRTRNLALSEARLSDIATVAQYAELVPRIAEFFEGFGLIADFHKKLGPLAEACKIEESIADSLVHTLFGFISLRNSLGVNAQELYDSLTYNIEKKADPTWRANNLAKWKRAKFDIIGAIRIDGPVSLSHKAYYLSSKHQFVFRDAQILTDLRPIFDDDATQVIGSVVSHILVLEYNEGEHRRNISIAMDMDDVETMRRICDRARTKSAKLKSLSQKSLGRIIIRGDE